ncbi:MAG: division/cell wall cluster transcriptional repressor MraZ [Lachnospiraceae bacterium]|nr:division/cell wall cluster transcriptional repressor MraZ [Lachnospiraceae bacterium]
MYKGDYVHTIDEKGRIIIPAKFREQLGSGFVITKGLDRCLWMLDAESWNKLEYKLRGMDVMKGAGRQLQRHFSASAIDGETDKQGRILLPPSLRTYAQLDKEVLVCGMINRIEIWNKSLFEDSELDPEQLAASAGELGMDMVLSF